MSLFPIGRVLHETLFRRRRSVRHQSSRRSNCSQKAVSRPTTKCSSGRAASWPTLYRKILLANYAGASCRYYISLVDEALNYDSSTITYVLTTPECRIWISHFRPFRRRYRRFCCVGCPGEPANYSSAF